VIEMPDGTTPPWEPLASVVRALEGDAIQFRELWLAISSAPTLRRAPGG
jgi:hypothetical protein